jgi:hypothetical protein
LPKGPKAAGGKVVRRKGETSKPSLSRSRERDSGIDLELIESTIFLKIKDKKKSIMTKSHQDFNFTKPTYSAI